MNFIALLVPCAFYIASTAALTGLIKIPADVSAGQVALSGVLILKAMVWHYILSPKGLSSERKS